LSDRGEIRPGARADVILVDDSDIRRPRLVAAIANGRLAYLNDSARLFRSGSISPIAFSSEVGTGSREENASKQTTGALL
jgi:alpha-D-ribose 1-methylphosphonate 5-triphosphate diphosphatase